MFCINKQLIEKELSRLNLENPLKSLFSKKREL
jgi:hypothetical protein